MKAAAFLDKNPGVANTVQTSAPNVSDRRENTGSNTTQDDSEQREVSALCVPDGVASTDAVEAALATVLVEAATAGRFGVVAQLARELARRLARAGSVVLLNAVRRKEGAE